MSMPWKVRSVIEERLRFVTLARERNTPFIELVRAFGISRKTGYKWLERYRDLGVKGCEDRSRAPKFSPQAFSPLVVKRLLAVKRQFPFSGPKKLLIFYREKYPRAPAPSLSTAGEWLKKAGLVKKRIRRRPDLESAIRRTQTEADRPNRVWCADFKGQFKLLNGEYCWPLTVTDAATRYLLACVALPGVHAAPVLRIFEKLFEEFGLPDFIRTDNGVPFATDGLYGLTVVSARWLRYGVIHERTRKGKPQDNGLHERFHRTLKEATALSPEQDMDAQQRAFNRFRNFYNKVRPHEALNMLTPASQYVRSTKSKPKLEELTYPEHFYRCRANRIGYIVVERTRFFIGAWATHEFLGLESVKPRRFRLHYANHVLGELDLDSAKLVTYGPIGSAARPRTFDSLHAQSTL